MIPLHLTEPWPETHPDRERIRKAAVDGFQNQDPSALTAAFCELPNGEKHNAWMYLTMQGPTAFVEFSKFVLKACVAELLVLHGIPRECTENVWPNVTPNFQLNFVRMPSWT